MKIVKIENKQKLRFFLENKKHSQFLQSWEWGEFQEKSGNKILRLGVEKNKEFLAVATLVKKNIGAGRSYFYCPRGPVHNEFQGEDVEEFLFKEIEKIAKKENVIFLRYEPTKLIQKSKIKNLKSIDLQPAKTLMLDLNKSEEDLLGDMHKKTRYNIRLARKKGVEIVEGGIEDFDNFWELMNKTSNRDGFRIHSKEYYLKMLDVDFIKIFFAKFEGSIIATGIFSLFGDTTTYMHGASDNEHRNVMAPYLLQWELIVRAKENGFRYYDFYGIDSEKWPGVTRFKKGFGGFEKKYPGTFDMVFSSVWYNGYRFLRRVRRMI